MRVNFSISDSSHHWIRYPFNADFHNTIILTLSPSEQVSFAEVSSDTPLKLMFEDCSLSEFWLSMRLDYPQLSNKALTLQMPV